MFYVGNAVYGHCAHKTRAFRQNNPLARDTLESIIAASTSSSKQFQIVPWASSIASLMRPDEAGVLILFGQTTPKAGESGIEFPAHIGYKSSS